MRSAIVLLAWFVSSAAFSANSTAFHAAVRKGHEDVPANVTDAQLACLAEGGSLNECFSGDGGKDLAPDEDDEASRPLESMVKDTGEGDQ